MDDEYFDLLEPLHSIRTIAVRGRIREIDILRKLFGTGRWKKRKGIAKIRLPNGRICTAELHWYEAHGIGRRKLKIKRIHQWL